MTEVRGKPKIPDVLEDCQFIYARNCVGCCLHIALDDGNLQDIDLKFCLQQAQAEGHKDCQRVAETMLRMSGTQRRKLCGMNHDPQPVRGGRLMAKSLADGGFKSLPVATINWPKEILEYGSPLSQPPLPSPGTYGTGPMTC